MTRLVPVPTDKTGTEQGHGLVKGDVDLGSVCPAVRVMNFCIGRDV